MSQPAVGSSGARPRTRNSFGPKGEWQQTRKEPLGSGSFASVYEGVHVETREPVAIKKVSWEKLERKEARFIQKHKQQLRNEIDAMKALNHVNVVRLIHHQNSPKYFIMVLEYCAGGDLASAVRARRAGLTSLSPAEREEAPVPEALALRLIRQLAKGLEQMRMLDWVHRDLKPGNLLLTSEDLEVATLKIADFGFAKSLKPVDLAETWVGSPLYMAPEVLFKESGGYDGKADLWSVGCILFELVFRYHPYGAAARDLEDLKRAIRADKKLQPDANIVVSDGVHDLLDRLLKRVPAQRISYPDFFSHPWLSGEVGTAASRLHADDLLRQSVRAGGSGVPHLLSSILAPSPAHPFPQHEAGPTAGVARDTWHAIRQATQEPGQARAPEGLAGMPLVSAPVKTNRQASGTATPDVEGHVDVADMLLAGLGAAGSMGTGAGAGGETRPGASGSDVRCELGAEVPVSSGSGGAGEARRDMASAHEHENCRREAERGTAARSGKGKGVGSGDSQGLWRLSMEETDEFELIDPLLAEALMTDKHRDRNTKPLPLHTAAAVGQGGAGEGEALEQALMRQGLPREVVVEGVGLASLVSDLVDASREVVALGNHCLRGGGQEGGKEEPACALVLYVWSMKMVHRGLLQAQVVDRRCGGMLPKDLVRDWQDAMQERTLLTVLDGDTCDGQVRLAGYLRDDYDKARLALRRCIQVSRDGAGRAAHAAWVTDAGVLNEAVLSHSAAPRASRLACATALKIAREAACAELLAAAPVQGHEGGVAVGVGPEGQQYYRASLVLCAVLLDWDREQVGEERGGVEGRAAKAQVVEYASLMARRFQNLKASRAPGNEAEGRRGAAAGELLDRVNRCAVDGRLWAVPGDGKQAGEPQLY